MTTGCSRRMTTGCSRRRNSLRLISWCSPVISLPPLCNQISGIASRRIKDFTFGLTAGKLGEGGGVHRGRVGRRSTVLQYMYIVNYKKRLSKCDYMRLRDPPPPAHRSFGDPLTSVYQMQYTVEKIREKTQFRKKIHESVLASLLIHVCNFRWHSKNSMYCFIG